VRLRGALGCKHREGGWEGWRGPLCGQRYTVTFGRGDRRTPPPSILWVLIFMRRWNGQTKAEIEAQYTGFSVVHGHVGYLREAYHGAPYATEYLVAGGLRASGWYGARYQRTS